MIVEARLGILAILKRTAPRKRLDAAAMATSQSKIPRTIAPL